VRREVEPLVGYVASLLIGLGMLVFAFWLQSRLPLTRGGDGILLPASFFGILTGFFITIARRKALTEILGYLALENGIFAFGAAALSEHPWMLEMGILRDVFVAVFIMGAAILHISREFDHIDADRLASLRDPVGES
jgi:hydrogenase-4 component E